MKKMIFGSVSLACVVITLASNALAGGGCGGGSYSGAGLSPSERAAIEVKMAKNAAELAEIDRHTAFLDQSIAAAKTVDLVLSQTAKLAAGSYGVATYHAGKVIGYVAMGEGKETGKSAIRGIFGIMEKAPKVYGAFSEATSFAISAILIPEPTQTLLGVTEVAISVTEFLQTLSKQHRWLLDNRITDAAIIDDAVGELSNMPFMEVNNLKRVFKVANMSNEEYVSFIRKVVIKRAKEVNPDLLTR